MQIRVLSVLLVVALTLPAFAAKRATSSGQVAHSRRAPVAMHRMFPPFAGNHVYEKPKPQAEPRPARAERDDRESSRRDRADKPR
jgi:hypothetical protein